MTRKIVVDSGPLIALFDKNDHYHAEAAGFLRKNRQFLYTVWPVVTEVEYVLDFNVQSQCDFLEWISRGGLSLVELDRDDLQKIGRLMAKYRDLPMDFADGSVIAACEKLETPYVATVDKDFETYRFQGSKKFTNLLG